MKKLKEFKVLNFDTTINDKKEYDVLPYFRNCWESNTKYDKSLRENVIDKNTLKTWIIGRSQYMFWSRCQYEHLMASWPFGSYKMKEKLKEFLKEDIDFDNIGQMIDFYNIICEDMVKIDIHEQIMMNIDIITDILYDEFKIENKMKKLEKKIESK